MRALYWSLLAILWLSVITGLNDLVKPQIEARTRLDKAIDVCLCFAFIEWILVVWKS